MKEGNARDMFRNDIAMPAESFVRGWRDYTRRFYLQDGTVEYHRVDNPPRIVWQTLRMSPETRRREWAIAAADPDTHVQPERISFTRRDYAYADDFIGPHRLSDYHELCPECAAWPDHDHEAHCRVPYMPKTPQEWAALSDEFRRDLMRIKLKRRR